MQKKLVLLLTGMAALYSCMQPSHASDGNQPRHPANTSGENHHIQQSHAPGEGYHMQQSHAPVEGHHMQQSHASGEGHLKKNQSLIPVILDTDANNELDDQHAIAYLVFNGDVFNVRGITVNATRNGGEVRNHYREARRVLQLCNAYEKTPLYEGANGDFKNIRDQLSNEDYDGKAAVEFIISEARKERTQPLVIVPIGKLTNVALALKKAPDIRKQIHIVWLGSNYPDPGEYNQDNDRHALNYLLNQNVLFELVTVRYDKETGSAAVRVTPQDMKENMPGTGSRSDPVTGRHGGSFTHFGDYSINLFKHIKLEGDPPSRSLYDVVALAILKNPSWGEKKSIPAPVLDIENNSWKERPANSHQVILWENFDKEAILKDFFNTMQHPDMIDKVDSGAN